jgi:hypothetical protein
VAAGAQPGGGARSLAGGYVGGGNIHRVRTLRLLGAAASMDIEASGGGVVRGSGRAMLKGRSCQGEEKRRRETKELIYHVGPQGRQMRQELLRGEVDEGASQALDRPCQNMCSKCSLMLNQMLFL